MTSYIHRSFTDDSTAFSDCNSDISGEFPTTSSESRRLFLSINSDVLIQHLITQLESSPSVDAKKQAAMELRLLAKNKPENRLKIVEYGAVKPLIFDQLVEELLKNYENVCTLRVRMPISSDLSNPRNFITKISRYEKVVNIPNSMTILDELLPISIEMAKRNLTGIYNFTNPGCVSHNEVLELYREYIDSTFTWKNFNLEEQAKVIVAPRSNNELDTTKLKTEFPELLSIKESLVKYVFEPNRKTPVAA
ncbi:bifunctional dTDP-4-dehydrorhamnose 3,5-epimerase/dTDP-4-dehydrorhamnose reductase [Tanacetum coccineum]|uniref:Bifunctional dTDP-4-dehydrorhamnose 3,5-epimerase/dTDP-4-dehydrorhamnose reductase n=1 Tax=Tanacetum coccineum TaxID=301880 RepID=A0ABQ5B5Q5_9ASTR